MQNNAYIAIAIAAVLSMVTMSTAAVTGQTETSTSVSGSFANVQTVQDDSHIVITITKAGGEVPTGPVIVIPPNETDTGDNGTIITPEPNATGTEGNDTDVIVIEPDGNVTQVPGNVTNIDNSTVIVAPSNQTVTETDGGVVVVDPVPCGCPPVDEEPTAPIGNDTDGIIEPLPPVVEEPVTNDTILVPSEPNFTEPAAPTEEPANETGTNVTASEPIGEPVAEGNETEDGGNDTGEGNDTGNPLEELGQSLGLQ